MFFIRNQGRKNKKIAKRGYENGDKLYLCENFVVNVCNPLWGAI